MQRVPHQSTPVVLVPGDSQSLEEARQWLRKAVTVPYEASDARRWLREFLGCVGGARRALAGRLAEVRGLRPATNPLSPLMERHERAQEELAQMADALFTDAYLLVSPDLLEMVDLTEAAKELERAILRERGEHGDFRFHSTPGEAAGG